MRPKHLMNAGPELDALVARKFMFGKALRYSTDPDCTAIVVSELTKEGYEVRCDDSDGVTCTLLKDSRPVASVWGITYAEAICRSALKIMGSNPA